MTTKTEKQAVTDYMKTGMRVPPGEPNTGELLGSAHAVTNQWPAGFKFLAVIDLRGWFVEVKRHGQMVAYSNPNPLAEGAERSREALGKPLLLKSMAQIQEVYGNELAGRPVLMLENDWTKCLENTEAAGACLITPTYRHPQTPETVEADLRRGGGRRG
jgi:hypothetical protein